MSRRREVEERRRALSEIEGVLGAMKNLALLETKKLARFLATQHRVVESVDTALADLVAFHPQLLARAPAGEVHLLVGSERGFCADFNERIVTAASGEVPHGRPANCVVVGYKLSSRLGDDARVAARIDGATVAEEVDAVLTKAMDALVELGGAAGSLRVNVIHNAPDQREPRVRRLDPLSCALRSPRRATAPSLTLDPLPLFRELVHYYLDAHLHELFYQSLAAENQRRLEHMEGAIDRVSREVAQLGLRRNVLRQEEITEEIEVILLTAEMLRAPS